MMYRGIAAKKGTKLSDIITPGLIKALNGDQIYKRDKDIERLARESEQRKLLAIAKDCKDLSEFIDKLNAILLEK